MTHNKPAKIDIHCIRMNNVQKHTKSHTEGGYFKKSLIINLCLFPSFSLTRAKKEHNTEHGEDGGHHDAKEGVEFAGV